MFTWVSKFQLLTKHWMVLSARFHLRELTWFTHKEFREEEKKNWRDFDDACKMFWSSSQLYVWWAFQIIIIIINIKSNNFKNKSERKEILNGMCMWGIWHGCERDVNSITHLETPFTENFLCANQLFDIRNNTTKLCAR